MKLFISGTTELNLTNPNSTMLKVKAFLDASKDGEVFLTEQLEAKTKASAVTLTSKVAREFPQYTHKIGSRRYWGKPSTIKQLIKETK
jgi:hypothetical protein